MKPILENDRICVWCDNFNDGMCEVLSKFNLILEHCAHVDIQVASCNI